jgi:tetratricopeptide (TPR) repeat protein
MTDRTPARAPDANRIALWIFVAFAILYVGTTRGHFVGTDEVTMYQTVQSIWENGDFSTSSRLPATLPARNGGSAGVFNAGQSLAALPLYGLGRAVEHGLMRLDRQDWIRTLAGPMIENGGPDYRWGGDVEIFFVNLFNAFVTALLISVFFLFSVELGASARGALAAALLLGTTTYVAPFSTGFLQHPSEALLVTVTFFLLCRDARSPSRGARLVAGSAFALLLLIRPQSGIAFPALAVYSLSVILRRRRSGALAKGFVLELGPLVLPLAAGLAVHLAMNYLRLGRWNLVGGYGQEIFVYPSLSAVYGFLFSPGESVFVFTPLLCLLPWLLPEFFRRHRAEAVTATFIALSYIVFYIFYGGWHGLWSAMGPRYLMLIVPLLLLPLAEWIDSRGRRAWLVIAPLAMIGLVVQLVNVAVNFAYVYNNEGYPAFRPKFGFLFIPDVSPLAMEWKALMAGDARVDLWLINVKRGLGLARFSEIALPLAALLTVCAWQLARALRKPAADRKPRRLARIAAALAAAVAIATAGGLFAASRHWKPKLPLDDADALMRAGLDALYTKHDPARAAPAFERVLEINPNHYGAAFQLASSLEWAGRRDEARSQWSKVLRMAESFHDPGTAANARRHLEALR